MESPRKMLRLCNLSKQNEQIPSLSGIHNRTGFMSVEEKKNQSLQLSMLPRLLQLFTCLHVSGLSHFSVSS